MHIALLPPVSPPSHTELAKCGDGYCHNGGQCSAEGICVCRDSFIGQFCEQEICKLCIFRLTIWDILKMEYSLTVHGTLLCILHATHLLQAPATASSQKGATGASAIAPLTWG